MGLPFIDSAIGRKRDQVMAVDLGSRTTKAVCVKRRGQGFALCGFTLLDAPIYEKTLPPELLSEHLKAIAQALRPTTKYVSLTAGVNDAQVRHVDIPRMPVHDMRMVLKLNTKNYLQQDLPNHVFDCHVSTRAQQPKPSGKSTDPGSSQKHRVLVAAARQQFVKDFVQGAKGAGLVADFIVPSLIGPVNTFEKAMPEVFAKEAVALVDIGFKNSSICILLEGELIITRVVGIGGDKLTSGVAEVLNISYAEAEGIKIGMPSEIQPQLESLLIPLGRELRASIDFFEHQQDRPVSRVFVTGGSARSEFIVQKLQQELMVECKILNPMTFLQMQLPPQQIAEIEQVAPQLTVALGAALAAL
ncbi:MAG: pilus assembly protein PilM [Verrucomicrobia bacterium]|nr:pilus assembly protein PilM [Verrucomicrobiota bacterium]